MIIDEDVFHYFRSNDSDGWKIILSSLRGSRGSKNENHKWHIGGTHYKNQLHKCSVVSKIVLVLEKAGRLHIEDDQKVDLSEVKWKARTDLCCDKDHWALALSEVSGSRLLVSNDHGLTHDFKKKQVPKGRVIRPVLFKKPEHIVRLLRSTK